MAARILLIEDDLSLAQTLRKVLRLEGYDVDLATRGDDGLTLATREVYDLVLSDLRLPGLDGLALVTELHRRQPRLPMVLMTAHGSTETAIEATKRGAFEYLVKPFEPEAVLELIASIVAQAQRAATPVAMGDGRSSPHAMVGRSRAMQEVYKQLGRVAATPVTVLIRGETGTGKELVARALHQHGDRAERPFIAVNCAALPETLLESELFGHERGAFTGAHQRRLGRFHQAQGGTLFLDEIGDLTPGTQAKLLRVLQERVIQPLGGETLLPVEARVLAASHRDLEAMIRAQEFREDLFYRLSVVTIRLPPLREHMEDIPELVAFFLRRHARALGVEEPAVEATAVAWLQTQAWPGNVRELENLLRQALLRARPFPISADHLREARAAASRPAAARAQTHAAYVTELLSRVERGEERHAVARMMSDLEAELYSQAIRRAGGNQAKAARWLGVTRLKVREKLIELGLHPRQEPDAARAGECGAQSTEE